MHIKKQQESCGKLKSLPMLELRLLFGFANVTTGKNNFSCKQKGDTVCDDGSSITRKKIQKN